MLLTRIPKKRMIRESNPGPPGGIKKKRGTSNIAFLCPSFLIEGFILETIFSHPVLFPKHPAIPLQR